MLEMEDEPTIVQGPKHTPKIAQFCVCVQKCKKLSPKLCFPVQSLLILECPCVYPEL